MCAHYFIIRSRNDKPNTLGAVPTRKSRTRASGPKGAGGRRSTCSAERQTTRKQDSLYSSALRSPSPLPACLS